MSDRVESDGQMLPSVADVLPMAVFSCIGMKNNKRNMLVNWNNDKKVTLLGT